MPMNHSFNNMSIIAIMRIMMNSIEIFDKLFMNTKGVIKEISRSKIRNKIVSIKKLTENGIFKMVFSLNPHSKFILIILYFFILLIFIIVVIIKSKLIINNIIIIKFIIFINF